MARSVFQTPQAVDSEALHDVCRRFGGHASDAEASKGGFDALLFDAGAVALPGCLERPVCGIHGPRRQGVALQEPHQLDYLPRHAALLTCRRTVLAKLSAMLLLQDNDQSYGVLQ